MEYRMRGKCRRRRPVHPRRKGWESAGRAGPGLGQAATHDAWVRRELINIGETMVNSAFGAGTDKGLPNRAKPEIWSQTAKFSAAADAMAAEVGKLEVAAKSGSLDAIKAAMGGVGKSCKACHDDFRAK